MARYRYSYQTIERYDTMVSDYQFLIRCTPMDTPFQKIEQQELYLLNKVDYNQSIDKFGNVIHYGLMRDLHDIFVVASSGVVWLGDYVIWDSEPHAMYKTHTKLTNLDADLLEFCKQTPNKATALETALDLSDKIFNFMKYSPGATNVETTASECFKQKEGVCQDYSHLLLSLCREKGIYSRYIVGYVQGTGETHSWTEIYSNGAWYGVDPTHNIQIQSGYIKIAHGRDATDCSVIRGIRRGVSTVQESLIRVIVEEII